MPMCPASGWRLLSEERQKADENRKREREEAHQPFPRYLNQYGGLQTTSIDKEKMSHTTPLPDPKIVKTKKPQS